MLWAGIIAGGAGLVLNARAIAWAQWWPRRFWAFSSVLGASLFTRLDFPDHALDHRRDAVRAEFRLRFWPRAIVRLGGPALSQSMKTPRLHLRTRPRRPMRAGSPCRTFIADRTFIGLCGNVRLEVGPRSGRLVEFRHGGNGFEQDRRVEPQRPRADIKRNPSPLWSSS